MKQVFVALLATALLCGCAINLNKQGTFERLQYSNPTHYRKIEKILEGLEQRSASEVPRWLQADFAARDVEYSPLLRTSYPPQRHLKFVLDATLYEAVVTLAPGGAKIVPTQFE
jgi:hypothetical protein